MISGIPKSETIWVKRTTSKGEIYYITSKENRDFYFLYNEENGKAVKIGKAKSPLELESKYVDKD